MTKLPPLDIEDDQILHAPPNTQRIEAVYAFMSVDDEGLNGICATVLPGVGATPMVTASLKAVELMKPQAERIAKMIDRPVILAKFTSREDIWATDV
jgi:hypothetical protein